MKFKEFKEQSDAIDSILALQINEEEFDKAYAMDILKKLEGLSAYLLRSKLQNPDDILRFEKFVKLVQKEMPKMADAVDDIESKILVTHGLDHVPAHDVKTSPEFDKKWADH